MDRNVLHDMVNGTRSAHISHVFIIVFTKYESGEDGVRQVGFEVNPEGFTKAQDAEDFGGLEKSKHPEYLDYWVYQINVMPLREAQVVDSANVTAAKAQGLLESLTSGKPL